MLPPAGVCSAHIFSVSLTAPMGPSDPIWLPQPSEAQLATDRWKKQGTRGPSDSGLQKSLVKCNCLRQSHPWFNIGAQVPLALPLPVGEMPAPWSVLGSLTHQHGVLARFPGLGLGLGALAPEEGGVP